MNNKEFFNALLKAQGKLAVVSNAVTVKKTADADIVFATVFPEYKKAYLDTICVYRNPSYPGQTIIEASFHLERGGKIIDAQAIKDNEDLLRFPDIFQEV